MTMAPFLVTLTQSGKRPARKAIPLDSDTREGAILCAWQWVVWSHARGRPKKLPRYGRYTVKEWDGTQWTTIAEGTRADATKNYREEDTTETGDGTVQPLPFSRRQGATVPWGRQTPRRNARTSRLANLVSRVLNDT